ncbi:hypothetical protein [Pararhizobium sp. PWRC1-1]|uniref:hypothetical protein n=1 Tax=Pararhizobium sp. PWRC1-1 TaxID=2804566 RepID=UPI003CF1FDAE
MPAITKRAAVEQMIDGAMRAHDGQQYAAAVTLAAAAGGAMPQPAEKALLDITRDAFAGYAATKEIVSQLNRERDWLKHDNLEHPDQMDIDRGSSLIYIIRAMSRFHAVYGREQETPAMAEFFAIARAFGPDD